MDAWKEQAMWLLRFVFADPASRKEFVLVVVSAVCFLLVALRLTSAAWGMKLNGWARIVLVGCFGILLTLAAVTAVRIYALPALSGAALQSAAQIAAVALVLLLVCIPLQAWILKGNYLKSLFTLLSSVLASVLLTCLVHTAFQALQHGVKVADVVRERKDSQQREISAQ